MSVYAPLPAYADHKRHPRALLLIIGGHAALLAAVMTARMDLPSRFVPPPTIVDLIDEQKPPPENPPPPQTQQQPRSTLDQPVTIVPIPQPAQPQVDQDPLPLPPVDLGPVIGSGSSGALPLPPEPVRVGPRFATAASDVKPPYPQSKLRSQEEAVLRLRLNIDDRGRVTAVDPVGSADPVFLAAARKHLIAHWRYRPATEDGRAVAASTVITLRFRLDQ
ncbi:MAG TPA: energy transducer TonB [Sphingomicrobium sp.]|nr:energy transducer TonB [Sphingomicrobium sp.]